MRLVHDLPVSVIMFCFFFHSHGFYFSGNFTNAKFCENKTLAEIFEFTETKLNVLAKIRTKTATIFSGRLHDYAIWSRF